MDREQNRWLCFVDQYEWNAAGVISDRRRMEIERLTDEGVGSDMVTPVNETRGLKSSAAEMARNNSEVCCRLLACLLLLLLLLLLREVSLCHLVDGSSSWSSSVLLV